LKDSQELADKVTAAGHKASATTAAAASSANHLLKPNVVLARTQTAHAGWVMANDPAVRPLVLWIDEPDAETVEKPRVIYKTGPFDLNEALNLAKQLAG